MPAAGKSYWAQKLAAAYGFEYIDLDKVIESAAGKSISAIFSEDGEAGFREKERQALHHLIAHRSQDTIIASGGGTPCYFDNMSLMLQNGTVIYLQTDIDTLLSRLEAGQQERPLLISGHIRERLQHLLHIRKPVFEKAHHILHSENISLATFEEIITSCTNRH